MYLCDVKKKYFLYGTPVTQYPHIPVHLLSFLLCCGRIIYFLKNNLRGLDVMLADNARRVLIN